METGLLYGKKGIPTQHYVERPCHLLLKYSIRPQKSSRFYPAETVFHIFYKNIFENSSLLFILLIINLNHPCHYFNVSLDYLLGRTDNFKMNR